MRKESTSSSYEEFSIGAMLPVVPLNSDKHENSLSDKTLEEMIDDTNKTIDKEQGSIPARVISNMFDSLDLTIEDSKQESVEDEPVVVEDFCFFEEEVNWKMESTKDLDDDIKDIIAKLNKKGYETKYSCSGHPSGRFKRDRFRDGILHKKLYSTARIVFAKDYDFPSIPKYWEVKVLDEDKTGIYVKPPTFKITDGLPVDAFNKWKAKYMYHLEKWVDKLPEEGKKKDEDVTLESVIDDLIIDTVE